MKKFMNKLLLLMFFSILSYSVISFAEELTPTEQSTIPLKTKNLSEAIKEKKLKEKCKSKKTVDCPPRQKVISANTNDYRYAAYMQSWLSKIEKAGNLDYKDELKQGLFGTVIADVAINSDGTLNGVTILRSSGNEILDNLVVSIAKHASPYAPFPDNIKKETDILHIMRTWIFK